VCGDVGLIAETNDRQVARFTWSQKDVHIDVALGVYDCSGRTIPGNAVEPRRSAHAQGSAQKEAQMLVRLSIIGAVTALLMVPATLSAQGVGGTVSTSVSRGIPTAADLERSSRSANKYRSLHKHTTPTKSRRRQ
jgi:hypothetical protein